MQKKRAEQVEGPLVPFAAGIEERLLAEGYLEKSVQVLMRLVAELSRWLEQCHLGANELCEEVVDEFFEAGVGRRCRRRSGRSLKLVMERLRSFGVVAPESVAPPGRTQAEAELLGAFGAWCVGQRGPTRATTEEYVGRAAAFLALWRPDGGAGASELDGRGVLGTVRTAAEVMRAPSLR